MEKVLELIPVGQLKYNWFDLAVLSLIGLGVYRGRARGMSEELLDVLKWLVIVVVGGIAYRPLGGPFSDYTHLNRVTSYIVVYFFVLVLVRLLFGWAKRMVGEKLVGSDVFGGCEYYFGMAAGAVRFACYIVVGLAMLNAKQVSPEQLAADARMQQENFGDISFPTLGTLQQTVFAGSASGIFVKKYLGDQLIVASPADTTVARAETLGRQKERSVYEALGEKR